MILSKQYLNELKDKRVIKESHYFADSKLINNKKEYDVFLSYSFNNEEYALMIYQLLEDCGYSVYIDYKDDRLNRDKVDRNTAKILASEMKKCKGLLYLHSSAASVSKWCPWELGYFSGFKNFMCATLPLTDKKKQKYDGQEYLQIYKQVEYETVKGKSKYEFWVFDRGRNYVTLREWLNNKWNEKRRK